MLADPVSPVPAPSPEFLLVLTRMEVELKRAVAKHGAKGFRKCRRKIVGPVRSALEARALPPNVVPIAAAQSPAFARYLATERSAAGALRAMCAACGGCGWAKR